jgi:arylsulfatase A-like enzyme
MKNIICLYFALLAVSFTAAASEKPNIIFFITDDYGWQDTSVPMWHKRTKTNDAFRTPSMEKLAQQGVKFTNAYTAASVCAASRISIITGQDPVRHGTTFITKSYGKNSKTIRSADQDLDGVQKEDVLLPALLRDVGYRTVMIGKAHFGAKGTFGADPLNLGFDRKHYANHKGSPIGKKLGGKDAYHVERNGKQVHLSEALTLEAKSEISQSVQDKKPFFLYLSHYAVHRPILEDKRFSQNYPNMDEKTRAYATLVEGADKSLGDVIAHINELGIANNTLIIWTADNGGLRANLPLKGLKNDAFEGGHRVPNIVAWGAQDKNIALQKKMPLKPGRVDNRPFIHQDWMPTLLNLAGTKHPQPMDMDGYDITALLRGDEHQPRPDLFYWHEPNFWAHSGPESSIRYGKWKLLFFYDRQEWQLYDLSKDIGEHNNVITKFPVQANKLKTQLIAYLKQKKANFPTYIDSGKAITPQL